MKNSVRFDMTILFCTLLFFIPILSACGESKPQKKPPAFQHLTQKDGLSSEMVYAIVVQGEEVWFGTYGGGASLYDKSRKVWKAYTTKGEPLEQVDDGDTIKWKNLLSYNHVSVILLDTDRIWFGTYFYGFGGGGISYFSPQRSPQWKKFDTNNGRAKKVVSMALDGEFLWVGSEKGLNLFDKKTERWKDFYSVQDGLSGNFVNTILVEPELLWIGTNGGISRFGKDKKVWKTYAQKEGLTDPEIKSLVKVGTRIWAGSVTGALFEYDAASDSWMKMNPTDPCKGGGIHSILVTREKIFICRDNGVSIYHLPKGQWESLTTLDGLLSNAVFCAAEDKESVWFGTDKGVSILMLTP
ncbi:MAG: ligand-binding sensor domain-containing protein [Thermodesulfobacteriota bacterium]